MMGALDPVLLVAGLIAFGLSAAGVPARVNWIGLGLLLVYLREII